MMPTEQAERLKELAGRAASYKAERQMLVAALEQIDRYARAASFGGWRHDIASIAGTALNRADQTAQSRRALSQEHSK